VCMSVPGQIVEIVNPQHRLARVDFDGQQRQVNLGLLAAAEGAVGDWVVVQAGLAVGVLSEEEAQSTLALLRELEQLYEEELS
jgi:hydrogenase expression/formation protein HypC